MGLTTVSTSVQDSVLSYKAQANADALSHLPLQSTDTKRQPETDIFTVRQIEALPITSAQLKRVTGCDPILSKVLQYIKQGWPDEVEETLKPYWNRRTELTLEDDCVMWGIRVVIPAKLQEQVLQELHRVHLRISKTKTLARSHEMTKSCERCQAVRNSPPAAPLHPWSWPSHPWQRIHLDFAGPFCGRMFLLLWMLIQSGPKLSK